MSDFGWQSEHSVEEWLFAEGHHFEFFQAVRLLGLLNPKATMPGHGSEPEKELVRFRSRVAFDFPPSDIFEIRRPQPPGSAAVMVQNFLGLAGAFGPLPAPFSQMIVERLWDKDNALRDFLDIFNHRLVSLMYRVREAHRPAFTHATPESSAAARYLYSFFGLGIDSLRNRMVVPDRALLYYSGLLSQRPRSAVGLERLLSDYFMAPVLVCQLEGAWRNIDRTEQTVLGKHGRNAVLGNGAVLGSKVWDQQGSIEIELGPLSFARFQHFLPGAPGYAAIVELSRFYVGVELEIRFRLVLAASEIPSLNLGTARLGYTSWLKTRPARSDDSQVAFCAGHD